MHLFILGGHISRRGQPGHAGSGWKCPESGWSFAGQVEATGPGTAPEHLRSPHNAQLDEVALDHRNLFLLCSFSQLLVANNHIQNKPNSIFHNNHAIFDT